MKLSEIKMLVTLSTFEEEVADGKKIDAHVLREQIGMGNMFAISGGRCKVFTSTVFFPVSNGYYVSVTLTGADDYTVRRLFIRSGKVSVKKEYVGIYAENVGEVAYWASCYENVA